MTLPNSIKSINGSCYLPSLTSINLPEGLETISEYAFNSCSEMKSFVLPSTIKSIGEQAFGGWGSQLESITYKGVKYTDKTEFNNKLKADGIATADVWVTH